MLKQFMGEVCRYLSEVIIINNRSTNNEEAAVQEYLSAHKLPVKTGLLRNDENYGLGGSYKIAFRYAIENGFDYLSVGIYEASLFLSMLHPAMEISG